MMPPLTATIRWTVSDMELSSPVEICQQAGHVAHLLGHGGDSYGKGSLNHLRDGASAETPSLKLRKLAQTQWLLAASLWGVVN